MIPYLEKTPSVIARAYPMSTARVCQPNRPGQYWGQLAYNERYRCGRPDEVGKRGMEGAKPLAHSVSLFKACFLHKWRITSRHFVVSVIGIVMNVPSIMHTRKNSCQGGCAF